MPRSSRSTPTRTPTRTHPGQETRAETRPEAGSEARAHARAGVRWGRIAAIAVTVTCLLYAPIAMTELWPYAWPDAPAPGQWLLGRSISPEYVAAAVRDRMDPYTRSLVPLITHSVLGGLLMLLGPALLLSAVRRRIRLHRALGIGYAAVVYAAMGGAAVYLARTRPEDAFSGAAFWIVLATLLVGTVLSVTSGVLSAVNGLPDLHQRWMLLCYGYLMTAPLLRIEWGVLPLLYPGLPLEDVNRVATMNLGLLVVLGAQLASRALDRRDDHPYVTGAWFPAPVLAGAYVAGAAGLVWLGHGFLAHGTGGRRLLLSFLVPYAAGLAIPHLRARRAGRRGAVWAREEWRTQLMTLCLVPVFSAGMVMVFQRAMHLDELTALTAGLGIGCGFMGFVTQVVIGVRVLYGREARGRRPARRSAERGVERAAHGS